MHEVANDKLLLPTQAQMCKVPCCSSKTLARRLALQLIPGTKPSYLAWRNGCYKKMARQRLPGDGQRGETGLALAKPMWRCRGKRWPSAKAMMRGKAGKG